ncbi:MAG: 30S ribosomal protein S6 [Candidatus Improbicoccus pseudotrichonymphae]|uniref:Small ribosomal subunit protein bS6 n=1 Tax=Candidatus Improbicoccus pseudotrichonymphae TaxID=3033792 RepID=A0AA48KWY1_9FIRM|nr:MAG: 30S ribosomal protein S6 [Candidatus Improbicoccus pseudotrichonymphae]
MAFNYNVYVIISRSLDEEAVDNVVKKISDIINSDGKVENVDNWGKRKFMYPIRKENEGIYLSIKFQSSGSIPKEIERVARITDGILRILIVKE